MGLLRSEKASHVPRPFKLFLHGESALRIERFFELIRGHARLSHHEEMERRIDVAGPCAHDQAFKRRQPHGSVYAQTSLNGCGTRAITEMERDEVRTLGGFAQVPGRLSRDVVVSSPAADGSISRHSWGQKAVHRPQ